VFALVAPDATSQIEDLDLVDADDGTQGLHTHWLIYDDQCQNLETALVQTAD
jgi:hypothetical protein